MCNADSIKTVQKVSCVAQGLVSGYRCTPTANDLSRSRAILSKLQSDYLKETVQKTVQAIEKAQERQDEGIQRAIDRVKGTKLWSAIEKRIWPQIQSSINNAARGGMSGVAFNVVMNYYEYYPSDLKGSEKHDFQEMLVNTTMLYCASHGFITTVAHTIGHSHGQCIEIDWSDATKKLMSEKGILPH